MEKKKKNPAFNHPQYPDTFAPLIFSPCHFYSLWIISPVSNLNILLINNSRQLPLIQLYYEPCS